MSAAKWLDTDFQVTTLKQPSSHLAKTSAQQPGSKKTIKRLLSFQDACLAIKTHFRELNEKRTEEEMQKWQHLQHEAVLGSPAAVQLFKDEIETCIRRQRLDVEAPAPYDSLVEGLFQETFGLGVISCWWKHPRFAESQSARIIGRHVFFDIPGERALQPFGYKDAKHVEEIIIEKLKLKDEFANISKYNPKLEIDMADGSRVMIMIPPRVRLPVIVFRNYTMPRPTLEQLARNGTMPEEMVPIVHGLSKAMTNIAVLGKVRSGKSTLLKALFGIRYREDQVAVNVERMHAELRLQELIPEGQIIEMIARTDADYEEIFDQVLRSDYHFCVVSELRSLEAEIYLLASERGEGGSMTTYHTDQARNMPGQIARLILQRYPSRSYEEELIRVAENLDIVYVMRELPGGAKRLDKICEIRLDPISLEVSVHDLARWEPAAGAWRYQASLSERTLEKLRRTAPDYADVVMKSLEKLAAAKPMTGPHVEVALSHMGASRG
ncbi:ATPase, T2SS/T4P/T4SS family [Paenibacillus sp. HB172176]|uniref:ATPase, T2SS/T4P/T4SS family n=1 Tax=Paenibacillus sp. HB172176 TaxID=2493690 RepID=UPI00143A6E53|nr:ATPase, T2SS/T4P/T4SS family [Paenibacillus sp. HB172176]